MLWNNKNKRPKVSFDNLVLVPVLHFLAFKESIELLTGLDFRIRNRIQNYDFCVEPGDQFDLLEGCDDEVALSACLPDIEPGDDFDLVKSPMTCL